MQNNYPVIISASRATDIPAFFAEWFINRVRAGYARWVNPFYAGQVQNVSFEKTRVFVFWSKNPKQLMRYLAELDELGFNYYFQFTVNDYEAEGLEPCLPPLMSRIETFRNLAEMIGKERVIWRYDPLVLAKSISVDSLLERVCRIANELCGFTEKLVISFADITNYLKVKRNLAKVIDYEDFSRDLMHEFAEKLSAANQNWRLDLATCAEDVDLTKYGIEHNRCIDDKLMVRLFKDDVRLMDFLGYKKNLFGDEWTYVKDKGQRKACGCIVSKDIGMYNSCSHFCAYCYANNSPTVVRNNLKYHNPNSAFLIDRKGH